jgi:hypothetical protein
MARRSRCTAKGLGQQKGVFTRLINPLRNLLRREHRRAWLTPPAVFSNKTRTTAMPRSPGPVMLPTRLGLFTLSTNLDIGSDGGQDVRRRTCSDTNEMDVARAYIALAFTCGRLRAHLLLAKVSTQPNNELSGRMLPAGLLFARMHSQPAQEITR